jgi:calcineurin-like phosphoesterase family protein
MHLAIENGWNETVKDNDIVIYLGDLLFSRGQYKEYVEGMLYRLNGTIHFVMGNHDRLDEIKSFNRFESIQDYLEVRVSHMQDSGGGLKKVETIFCSMHYPLYSWNQMGRGSITCHGHCHGNLHHGEDASYYVNRRAIDVGCMLHDYKPISYLSIIYKLKDIKPEIH